MNYLLFTTQTCPKCPEVKDYVSSRLDFPGRTMDNRDTDFMNLAVQHGVQQAPTLLVFDGEGREVFRANEVGEIDYWLRSRSN